MYKSTQRFVSSLPTITENPTFITCVWLRNEMCIEQGNGFWICFDLVAPGNSSNTHCTSVPAVFKNTSIFLWSSDFISQSQEYFEGFCPAFPLSCNFLCSFRGKNSSWRRAALRCGVDAPVVTAVDLCRSSPGSAWSRFVLRRQWLRSWTTSISWVFYILTCKV